MLWASSTAAFPCESLSHQHHALFSTNIVGDEPILVSSVTRLHRTALLLTLQFHFVLSFLLVPMILCQVRDFIHSALYDPKHGYFSQRAGAVGVLESSIKFNKLEGK